MKSFSNKQLRRICEEIRHDVFETIRTARSGHLGGCSSSTELMASLYFGGILNYNSDNPFDKDRDRVIVRGHLGPLRYKIFSMLGWIGKGELKSYRSLGSRLQGHESMDLVPGVDITPSGSLGMGLSYGVGAAIAAREMGKQFTTYVFLGDGEEQEGNVSEAARHASKCGLNNLVSIIDKNGKQLSHPTSDVDSSDLRKIWEGYGWGVMEINGHNFNEIRAGFDHATQSNEPFIIIANTIKGKGIEGAVESINGYHTISSCSRPELDSAISEREGLEKIISLPRKKHIRQNRQTRKLALDIEPPVEIRGLEDATDIYLKEAEKRISDMGVRFYLMTADLIDRNYIDSLELSPTTRFIDVGIREQHLFSSAHGISVTDENSRIWIHSGDSFLYRGSDQLNAICQGKSPMLIIGDRPGLGGGKNGPTHQSSGQPGLLLTMPGLTYLEPADMDDLFGCLNYALNEYQNPMYVRLHPEKIDTLPSTEEKNISNYIVFEPRGRPHVTLVGSGLAMRHTVQAVQELESEGIHAILVNVVNPKTLDEVFVEKLADNVPVITLFNGNKMVLESAVSTSIMRYPRNRPNQVYSHGFEYGVSGSVKDLLIHFGFGVDGIKDKIKEIIR